MSPVDRLGLRAPFDVPPHHTDPTGVIAVWFTDPPGAVAQLVRPLRFTADLARWLVGDGAQLLWDRYPAGTKLLLVLDLSLMDGRENEARAIIREAAKENRTRIVRTLVVPPRTASATYVNALHVAVAVLKVLGVGIDVEPSLTAALVACRMRVARA